MFLPLSTPANCILFGYGRVPCRQRGNTIMTNFLFLLANLFYTFRMGPIVGWNSTGSQDRVETCFQIYSLYFSSTMLYNRRSATPFCCNDLIILFRWGTRVYTCIICYDSYTLMSKRLLNCSCPVHSTVLYFPAKMWQSSTVLQCLLQYELTAYT